MLKLSRMLPSSSRYSFNSLSLIIISTFFVVAISPLFALNQLLPLLNETGITYWKFFRLRNLKLGISPPLLQITILLKVFIFTNFIFYFYYNFAAFLYSHWSNMILFWNYELSGYASDRIFAPYSVYKGKAAFSLSPCLPTFTKLDVSVTSFS
jgi:hypothetical protein